MIQRRPLRRLCGALLVLLVAPVAAQAQTVAEFYRGKTVNVYIGVGVGGEYDIQARLVARHLGKHIPGNPTVVAQNMTGAGGLRMINYLYNIAPKDGANIGMIANAFPAIQAAGIAGDLLDVDRAGFRVGRLSYPAGGSPRRRRQPPRNPAHPPSFALHAARFRYLAVFRRHQADDRDGIRL